MLNGTAYGVVLNDRLEREKLAAAFGAAPYNAPPRAPVLYIKPRICVVPSGSVIDLSGLGEVVVAPTLALLFGRDASKVRASEAISHVAAGQLALDLSEAHASYYRPAVSERCRDGFLPLGAPGPLIGDLSSIAIETAVDGEKVHSWSLDRLHTPVAELIEAVTDFMTLSAGDILLVGLPGDAPVARDGSRIEVSAPGLPALQVRLISGVRA